MRSLVVLALYALLIGALVPSCSRVTLHTRPDLQGPARVLSPGERARDYRITNDFKKTLEELDPRFRQTAYGILVFHGTVILVGRAFDESMRTLPMQVVQSVGGIRRFFNYMTVGPPLGLLEKTNDFSANANFRSALVTYSGVDTSIVKSTVFANKLYLMGYTTKQQALTVVELASQIEGIEVVKVFFEYVYPDGNIINVPETLPDTRNGSYQTR